jgi:hypothetical protein
MKMVLGKLCYCEIIYDVEQKLTDNDKTGYGMRISSAITRLELYLI